MNLFIGVKRTYADSDNVIVVNSLRGSICLDPNSKLRVTLYKRTNGERIKAHSFNEK